MAASDNSESSSKLQRVRSLHLYSNVSLPTDVDNLECERPKVSPVYLQQPKFRATAAIDIGSGFSGYAYCIESSASRQSADSSSYELSSSEARGSGSMGGPGPGAEGLHSYSYQDEPQVRVMRKPLDGSLTRQLKTATALLLDAAGELQYFGFKARDVYIELRNRQENRDWNYFERFKQVLYNARVRVLFRPSS